jgi:hypothetical protein
MRIEHDALYTIKQFLFIKPKWTRSIFILILPGPVQRMKKVSKNPSGLEGKNVMA